MNDPTTLEVTVPPIALPFQAGLNPLVTRLEQAVPGWLREYGADKKYGRGGNYGRLAARMYPTAPWPVLSACGLAFLWTFLFDDAIDPDGASGRTDQAETLVEQAMAAVAAADHEPVDNPVANPVVRCLEDLLRQVRAPAGPAWRQRFERDLGDFLAVMLRENRERGNVRTPDVQDYLVARRVTCTWPLAVDLMELAEGIEPGERVRSSASYTQMYEAAADITLATNELLSLPKEFKAGELHNLVLIIADKQNCALTEAIAETKRWLDGRLRDYRDASESFVRSVGSAPPQGLGQEAARRYVNGLEYLMSGILDWQLETSRYTVDEPHQ